MSDELEHITDLQHVRARPMMYFGDLEAPSIPNCLAREAYCLAIDQITADTCSALTSIFTPDGFACVSNDGNPLGIESQPRFGDVSEMQAVAEAIGICAERADHEHVRSNVCKSGMTALNAVCERFELHNYHDRTHYLLAYDHGAPVSPMLNLGSTKHVGVMVRFKPDPSLFRYTSFDVADLKKWFESLSLDISSVDVRWDDQRNIDRAITNE